MPIINMVSRIEDIPAAAANVREHNEEAGNGGHYWTYDSHVGLCISDYERNGRDDSDFYMIVWNAETNSPDHYCFASTRGWSYPCYGSRPDATPEVMAAYEAWQERIRECERQRHEEWEAKQPARGKTLRVVKGRKVAKGTEGICIWTGNFTRAHVFAPMAATRVGLKDASGVVHWTAASNVEVVA